MNDYDDEEPIKIESFPMAMFTGVMMVAALGSLLCLLVLIDGAMK